MRLLVHRCAFAPPLVACRCKGSKQSMKGVGERRKEEKAFNTAISLNTAISRTSAPQQLGPSSFPRPRAAHAVQRRGKEKVRNKTICLIVGETSK